LPDFNEDNLSSDRAQTLHDAQRLLDDGWAAFPSEGGVLMRKDGQRSGVRVKTEIWAAMLELPSNVTQIRQSGSLDTAVAEERTAAVEQHRRNMDAFAFAQWRTALDGSDAAEQELRAALRAKLFKSDRLAFDVITARAQRARAFADEKLIEVFDALRRETAVPNGAGEPFREPDPRTKKTNKRADATRAS
jgi:hypothetical protein